MVLLDKVTDHEARKWYAERAVEHGWSRAVLTHHIATNRHTRVGAAPNNFPATLAPVESDLAREIVQDPYDLDFLALDPGYTERELEEALVARMTHFFTELGDGFAFVGRQYRLPVGDQDYFIDLLFFHLGLRRYVVFELKVGRVEPEHLGKLNFYVNAVDDLLRRPEHGDGSSIGILLAADRDDIVAGLRVTVCHLPPGTSKWNKIEHRLFAHITMNWRGTPLTSHQTVVNLIGAVTTTTGLKVHAELDEHHYPTGIRISDADMQALPLHRHEWHGEWNYSLTPGPDTPDTN